MDWGRTDGGEFRSHMQDHYHCHDECCNVREGRGALEDNRVGQFNVARIAVGLYARRTYHACDVPDH